MKIAIQGHPTKGYKVIQILEGLGGKNIDKLEGTYETFYYIDDENEICDDHKKNFPPTYKLYTLKEFEKEFPFKIGDEVMFPVINGWLSGKITDIKDFKYEVDTRIGGYRYVEPHKLQLYPMKEERNITLTLDKAKEWYKKGGELKEIALQAFSEKELIKVVLPKTWEEFCENYLVQKGECWLKNADVIGVTNHEEERLYKNWIPSKKSAEAHLAMIQLEQLRNCWWNGWKPTWDGSTKYTIKRNGNEITVFRAYNTSAFLVFPTREMAEEFLECFRDLIEKAGDLI